MSTDIPALWAAIRTGSVREIAEHLKPELGTCDDCGERQGTTKIVSADTDTLLCDACVEDDYREMRRLPRFRTREDRDAWMAGSRARGEI